MKSLDTSVLARFFVDDPDDAQASVQRPAAVAALSQRAFVSVTVLLAFEWVRGSYDLPPTKIAEVMLALAGIEHITIEDRAAVLAALDAFQKGMAIAGALRLARSGRSSAFATFDRGLAKRARTAGMGPPVDLLG